MKKIGFGLLLLFLGLAGGCRGEKQESATAKPAASAMPSAAPLAPRPSESAPSTAAPSTATPSTAAAPEWKRPLLYRVGKAPKAWYVFGTIHVPDGRLDTFPPELEAALRESDRVYTEIPMDDATQAALAPRLMLPEGQSLSTLVPPKLYERVSGAFAAHGIPMAPFERMKPWAVSVQVAVLDKLFVLAIKKPLDAVLYQRAQAAGKTVGGLETPEEQLGLFDELTPKEQVELLEQAVDFRDKVRAEKRDALAELLDAYVAGKEDELLRLVKEDYDPKDPVSVKLMKRVFTDRNRTLAERMLARVAADPGKVQLFAVGSGHLVGDDGIVERLRKQGLAPARVP
jgi:uncharacterized protein YbaP (TraB family)